MAGFGLVARYGGNERTRRKPESPFSYPDVRLAGLFQAGTFRKKAALVGDVARIYAGRKHYESG